MLLRPHSLSLSLLASSLGLRQASVADLLVDVLVELQVLVVGVDLELLELPGAELLREHDVQLFKGAALGLWQAEECPD